MNQQQRADELKRLSSEGTFIVPNAWDVGSAIMIEKAGASAIATTSAGVSWTLGRPDGQGLTREEMVDVISRIAAAVDLPVSADIEGGYGRETEEVAKTVTAIIEAGAVGINLEDSTKYGEPLFTIEEQSARIAAARAAANDGGLESFVINARTDVYLFEVGEAESRYDETLKRAGAYDDAGADTLFVPGLTDLEVIWNLVKDAPLPINIMSGWQGAPTVEELSKAGVRRVSMGVSITQGVYTLIRRAAAEAVAKGTYSLLDDFDPYGEIDGSFPRRS